jgi:glycerol-3-phosphate dehydrogenase (NAD(P)+)
MRTAVIGAGSWGTALAQHLGLKGFPVRLWVHDAGRAKEMAEVRENRAYLPGIRLVDGVAITHQLGEALDQAELVLEVVPSHAVRTVMREAAQFMHPGAPIVTCSKGIENDSLMTMLEVLEDVLPVPLHPYLAVRSSWCGRCRPRSRWRPAGSGWRARCKPPSRRAASRSTPRSTWSAWSSGARSRT